jgi:hypothetical protein
VEHAVGLVDAYLPCSFFDCLKPRGTLRAQFRALRFDSVSIPVLGTAYVYLWEGISHPHCHPHCHLEKFPDLMIKVKYGAVIGYKDIS